MNFITTIKDTSGHILFERETKAEPKFVPTLNAYAFLIFDRAFYLMLTREAYEYLERNKR